MRVVIAGSSGLIGQPLTAVLRADGHDVVRLIRRSDRRKTANTVVWAPERGILDPRVMEGLDAVINLAGRNVADARWSRRFKQELRSSRLDATRTLATTIQQLDRPPRVFLNASSIGLYGDRGNERLDERSEPGRGFLAELCTAWEELAETARRHVRRVVHLRFGVVLAGNGGALEALVRVARRGAGGTLGSGHQIWSWIALTDAVNVIRFATSTPAVDGPVNVVSPNPVTNTQLAGTLSAVLGHSTGRRLPATMLRLSLGEIADALLLASADVTPSKLLEHGFQWRYGKLEDALREELGSTDAATGS